MVTLLVNEYGPYLKLQFLTLELLSKFLSVMLRKIVEMLALQDPDIENYE
jgi:hypothetical protein